MPNDVAEVSKKRKILFNVLFWPTLVIFFICGFGSDLGLLPLGIIGAGIGLVYQLIACAVYPFPEGAAQVDKQSVSEKQDEKSTIYKSSQNGVTECPYCHSEVGSKEITCPYCRFEILEWKKKTSAK